MSTPRSTRSRACSTRTSSELEKRIAIEARYIWFQKERQRVENVLRKIYAANDVSSLLDIIPDIKDIVQAGGATIYVLDENETLGKYLKPLVWDDAFLTHLRVLQIHRPARRPGFCRLGRPARHGDQRPGLAFDKRLSKVHVLPQGPPEEPDRRAHHARTKVIGVVEVYNKTVGAKACPEGFTREDQEILRGLSEHIAIAMAKLNLIQYDPLTGLLRPDPFFEKVLQKINALSKRRREEGSMALVMGDVDWFKDYNDRNGHEAGNKLLRELADVLKLSIREEDLLCRYGGEEFLFFLTGVDSVEEACLLTDRIRKNIEEHYFELQEFQPRGNLTMSFGVTIPPRKGCEQSSPITKSDLKRLAGEADLAMAEAKGKPRPDLKSRRPADVPMDKNRVCSFFWEEIAEKEDGGLGRGGPPRPGEAEIRALQRLDALPFPGERRLQGRQDRQYQPRRGADRLRLGPPHGQDARNDPRHRRQGQRHPKRRRLFGERRRRQGALLFRLEVQGPDL